MKATQLFKKCFNGKKISSSKEYTGLRGKLANGDGSHSDCT